MKSEWSIKPLSECIELIIDYRGKTPKKLGGDWSKTGYRALSAKNVKTSGLVQEDIIRRIDDDIYKKWMKEEVKRGDILLTSEAPLGEVLLWDSDEKIVLSQRLFAIRPNKNLDSAYMFYYMSAKKYQHELESRSTGTTVVGIKQTQLVHTVIEYPKLDTQKRIAHILSTLDDKIELNRKMNQTLEEMAQTLYKSWFVDFDPVHAKASCTSDTNLEQAAVALGVSKEVFELFPNAFVESEMGMIPEGWEAQSLGNICTVITKGTTPRKVDIQNAEDDATVPFIKVKDIAGTGEITRESLEVIPRSVHTGALKRSMLKEDDLLFSIAGTIGRVSIVDSDLDNANTNQAVGIIRLKDKASYLSLIWLALQSSGVQKNITSKVVQGVQANTSLTNLKDIPVLLPTGIILNKWNNIAGGLMSRLRANQVESRTLQKTRDTLLPKLLSGELDVSEVEI